MLYNTAAVIDADGRYLGKYRENHIPDITIYDPGARTRIGVATHHMNLDHSAYEGFEIRGGVDAVLSRGKVILDGGAYTGRPGHGRFVKHGLSQYLV